MKSFVLLFLLTLRLHAAAPLGCGRYIMVGEFSCESSPCLLKVYPKSISEMVFEVDEESSFAVKRLTGKNVRASVTLYQTGQDKPKLRFYRQIAMEYPPELGPKAIKLISKEKCE